MLLHLLDPHSRSSRRSPSCSARPRARWRSSPAPRRACWPSSHGSATTARPAVSNTSRRPIVVPEWSLSYLLAADGLSLVMLLLTGLVTLAAVWVAPRVEKPRRAVLRLHSLHFGRRRGGVCLAGPLLLLRLHELALIPTFLLIGLWGIGRTAHRRVENHHLSGARQLHPADRARRSLSRRCPRSTAPST